MIRVVAEKLLFTLMWELPIFNWLAGQLQEQAELINKTSSATRVTLYDSRHINLAATIKSREPLSSSSSCHRQGMSRDAEAVVVLEIEKRHISRLRFVAVHTYE